MGTNMHPSSALLGQNKDKSNDALPLDQLIGKADGFAGVFPAAQLYVTTLLYGSLTSHPSGCR
uniref:Uncharacterized protein n=1 Tax=Rhizophora mucronata TaxID=61149 RepID=A0A2P2JC63_RHIMU